MLPLAVSYTSYRLTQILFHDLLPLLFVAFKINKVLFIHACGLMFYTSEDSCISSSFPSHLLLIFLDTIPCAL